MNDALLAFTEAAVDELPRSPPLPLSALEAQPLRQRGLLRQIPALASLDMHRFAVQPHGDGPQLGEIEGASAAAIHGHLVDDGRRPGPGLVLITRQTTGGTERVSRICAPNMFVAGDRVPWTAPVAALQEGESLRAYAFVLEGLRLHPLPGTLRVVHGVLTRKAGG